jgi:nucleoside-diphosphate-sugar epimerase
LASHVSLQFLERGYKVRGTVRDPAASSWLKEGPFKTYADAGYVELVSVLDLGAAGAFDEAIKGVSAVLHIAYVTNIVPDPKEVITPLVNSVRSIVTAAIKEPSVKEVVFTGSALNTSPLTPHVDNGVIGRDSWNEGVLKAAWAPAPYEPSRAMLNYPASKTAAEKEVWRLVEENDLQFNVSVVSPAGITGEPLNQKHIDGPANWVMHGYRGHKAVMDSLQSSKSFPRNLSTCFRF